MPSFTVGTFLHTDVCDVRVIEGQTGPTQVKDYPIQGHGAHNVMYSMREVKSCTHKAHVTPPPEPPPLDSSLSASNGWLVWVEMRVFSD